jgi:GAF domain-containing protein
MPTERACDFAALSRLIANQPSLEATLDAIVRTATKAINGADFAAITTQRPSGKFETVASTDVRAQVVDDLQYATGEGPCVDSIREHHVFRSDYLPTDERWPIFGRLVTNRTEVLSMLCHRLFLEEETTLGALNLYSIKPAAFTNESIDALDVLATHAAIAFAKAQEQEENAHLQVALSSNRTIGIAMGILMSSQGITRQHAFDALRIASQHSHRKLVEIAKSVEFTGELTTDVRADVSG